VIRDREIGDYAPHFGQPRIKRGRGKRQWKGPLAFELGGRRLSCRGAGALVVLLVRLIDGPLK
jgi:hypothetical protein